MSERLTRLTFISICRWCRYSVTLQWLYTRRIWWPVYRRPKSHNLQYHRHQKNPTTRRESVLPADIRSAFRQKLIVYFTCVRLTAVYNFTFNIFSLYWDCRRHQRVRCEPIIALRHQNCSCTWAVKIHGCVYCLGSSTLSRPFHDIYYSIDGSAWRICKRYLTYVCAGRTEKRRERVLSDGCSCHRTAVAVAALTQYTRYIIEALCRLRPNTAASLYQPSHHAAS